jgi:ketosteroid isomerase-like protein
VRDTARPVSRENVERIRRNLDAWNRGDLDGWLETAGPEIEWISEMATRFEGGERVFRGADGLREYWDEWHSLWDVTIDVVEIRDLGQSILVIAQVRTRGVASGVNLEGDVAYVYDFDGDVATRCRSYLDLQAALEAVGLSQ